MEDKAVDHDGLAKSTTNDLKAQSEADGAKKPVAPVEDVPDPDEDDLDDLDDMLDEFSSEAPSKKGTPLPPSQLGKSELSDAPSPNDTLEDDFARQMQAGMAELLGEMEKSPEMQSQFEAMMKDLSGAAALGEEARRSEPPPGIKSSDSKVSSSSNKGAVPTAGDESFQETIKKTMERMQASGQQATAAAAADDTDDILAEIMKQMAAGGIGDGEGGEEDFSKMLLGMMEQLTNKDILYEPMKELHDKYPAWMDKNNDNTPKSDMERYIQQKALVSEIVERFEQPTYADSNAADREYIVDRMQKMQAAGSPPADLVGDMASAQEAFGAPEEGCPQQ